MVKTLGVIAIGLSLTRSGLVWAASKVINGVRIWRSPEKTRLVFDVSGSVAHSELTLGGPDRLVIDVNDARLSTSFSGLALKNTPIRKIRYATRNKNDLRVVLDLKAKVSSKSFLLSPNATYGHRLVVDLFDKQTPMRPVVNQQPSGRRILSLLLMQAMVVKTQVPELMVVAMKTCHPGYRPGTGSTAEKGKRVQAGYDPHRRLLCGSATTYPYSPGA